MQERLPIIAIYKGRLDINSKLIMYTNNTYICSEFLHT